MCHRAPCSRAGLLQRKTKAVRRPNWQRQTSTICDSEHGPLIVEHYEWHCRWNCLPVWAVADKGNGKSFKDVSSKRNKLRFLYSSLSGLCSGKKGLSRHIMLIFFTADDGFVAL